MGAHRGEMELVITSASRLEDRVVRRLETAVGKSELSAGKKVKVVTKVWSNQPVTLSVLLYFWC